MWQERPESGYDAGSAEGLDLDVYFMMPSCVPSTGLDEAGAVLHAVDLEPFYADDTGVWDWRK